MTYFWIHFEAMHGSAYQLLCTEIDSRRLAYLNTHAVISLFYTGTPMMLLMMMKKATTMKIVIIGARTVSAELCFDRR